MMTMLCSQVAVAQSDSMLPPEAPNRSQTVLAQAARTIGVRRCQAAVDQVSNRMFAQAKHTDVALDWDRNNPDGEPFFSLSGLEYQDTSAVLSLTTVPSTSGGCTILVERISSAPTSCKEVVRSTLAGYKSTPLVKAVTVYVNPARPRETVTLIDAPPSCLIVRRQTEFHWGAGR
ncbi:hypothetical protein [Burkholderia pyrrocinia]|uniref:hypothetical protein n=1 Tax=Burkholderia pyrrocinia TaxID=60550 RepID=UPI001BCF70AF|nr:hypothetical protein [Burkholderia pyrrocinia]QVN22999.1 hypothetical protein JYG32_36810 [Burkholderia pyrrocinia]